MARETWEELKEKTAKRPFFLLLGCGATLDIRYEYAEWLYNNPNGLTLIFT